MLLTAREHAHVGTLRLRLTDSVTGRWLMLRFRFAASPYLALCGLALAGLIVTCGTRQSRAGESDWASIREELFGDRPIEEAGGIMTLYAPAQAADAAIVPVTIRFPHATAKDLKSLTLVIDRNPAPVAASFEFGPGYHPEVDAGERLIETRIRLDSFSKVRAIAESKLGKLYMASTFVAGAGGCASPSSKDADEALSGLGEIKLKVSKNDARGEYWRDARIMIRHPNFTGMQMDMETRGYTPARFVDLVEVHNDHETIFRLNSGISISENPNIRFTYGATAPQAITVRAKDSSGAQFTGSLANAEF